MKLLPAIIISFLVMSSIAGASTITLNQCGQDDINQALLQAGENGTVILTAGTYEITGPIYVPRNINLIGEAGAKILVSDKISSPWFSPTVGVVNCFDPFNVNLDGIEIDGNCHNLPNEWANSGPEFAHNQQQLIKVIGSSGNFGKNIKISNMKLHNSFGDGIQARCIDGIICENNEIINTQHESIYYSACKNCKMLNNRMSIITSDGGRFDNCINGEAEGNIVWQYNGSNANGAWKGGANGFQVSNAGASKGYDGRKDWISTQNVEIHDNIISDPGRQGIAIYNVDSTSESNIYIHDNVFKNTTELRTMGIPVDDYSWENPPTKEEAEEIFSSIFDILNLNFISPTYTRINSNLTANITEVRQGKNTYYIISMDYRGLQKVIFEYGGNKTEYNLKYGSWEGVIPHQGDSLFLTNLDSSGLKITCYTNSTYFEIKNYNAVKEENPKQLFNPLLILILLFLAPWVWLICFTIRKVFTLRLY